MVAWFCAERAMGSMIVLGTPDELLGDVGLVESRFGPFRDSVNLSATYVDSLGRMYPRLENRFEYIRWNS
jgi:hypothetical protein